MMCHHIATMILITFSYVCGLTHIGVHVLFLMDNGDIFVGFARTILDWAGLFYVTINWFLIMISFIYFRLFVYWVEVLKMSFFCPKGFHNNSRVPHALLTALLMVLFFLNIYWGFLLLKMGLGFLDKGKIKDLHFKIDEKEKNLHKGPNS